MGKRSRYSPEVRERAVRMVWEHAGRTRLEVGSDPFDRGEDRVRRRRPFGSGYSRLSEMRGDVRV